MIAAPALDLRRGRCVQLVGGRPEDERVCLPDPGKVARSWREAGFQVLHVVDLDAALGEGDNREAVGRLARETDAALHVGGGIRTDADAEEILGLGARRIVVGTRALEEPSWLAALSERHPGRVMLAADSREGQVLTHGWKRQAGIRAVELVEGLRSLPLGGILWTDVGKEGRMEGISLQAAREMVEASAHPVWVSGGVSSMDDLAALAGIGARGAVLGMALYQGALDPGAVAAAYGAEE